MIYARITIETCNYVVQIQTIANTTDIRILEKYTYITFD